MTPYYHDEASGIAIYHGDCRDVLPLIDFAVIATDVPYGVGVDYGTGYADSHEAFVHWVRMLAESGKPAATTMPSTKIHDVPRPDWWGCWHKPLTLGYWNTPLIPHWEPVAFYNMGSHRSSRGDVVSCNPERKGCGHPTPKPIALFQWMLKALPDGVAVDPFMGSGQMLVAARLDGRRAIGIEINERYCEIAANRLAQGVLFTSNKETVP